LAGSFFRPLAIGYVLAILASLSSALIVTPALSLMILPSDKAAAHEPPLGKWLKGPYNKGAVVVFAAPRGR